MPAASLQNNYAHLCHAYSIKQHRFQLGAMDSGRAGVPQLSRPLAYARGPVQLPRCSRREPVGQPAAARHHLHSEELRSQVGSKENVNKSD